MEGADCKVNEDVAKSIRDFHAAKKPIGSGHCLLKYMCHNLFNISYSTVLYGATRCNDTSSG